jgi:Uncharacterized conserved protein
MLKIKDNIFSGLGIFFIFFLFLVACSRVPQGIIPERAMQQILCDMHLADAIIISDYYSFQTDEDKKALFQSVFDKHNITEAVYDSSLVWYGKNLDVYMQVYNMALAEVKKRIEEMGEIEPERDLSSNEDMVDIWSISRNHEFYPSSLSNNLLFNIKPEDEFSSGSIFVLSLRVFGLVSDISSPIEVHLRAEQNDTTIIMNNTIPNDGFHEFIIRTNPSRKVKQVHGYIRLNSDTVSYHKVYLNDFRLMKYRYGSEAAGKLDSVQLTMNNE